MFAVISNTVQSKISLFVKFIWEDQHKLDCFNQTTGMVLSCTELEGGGMGGGGN